MAVDTTERLIADVVQFALIGGLFWLLVQLARILGRLAQLLGIYARERLIKLQRERELADINLQAERRLAEVVANMPEHYLAILRRVAVQIEYHRRMLGLYREYLRTTREQESRAGYADFLTTVTRNRVPGMVDPRERVPAR